MLGATDFLCDNYLGCCDSAVHIISRKTQVFQVFSHLDTEGVAVHCLKVQSLWTQHRTNKQVKINQDLINMSPEEQKESISELRKQR